MPGPLDGVRVVDLTTTVLGPFASQILGDMGAEVWKVEPPSGDTLRGVGPARSPEMGAYFLHLNRNKRSVVLDLKSEGGRSALQRMIVAAAVLLYANRPRAMARLGLSYERVAAINPRMIYCGAFGYGQRGPYADRPAYDDLIQGASGLAALQADRDGVPRYAAVTLADRVVGMAAASAIGMALYRREKTGTGQAIEIPTFETMVEFVMGDHLYGATFEPPVGSTGYPRLLHRRPYRTSERRPTGSARSLPPGSPPRPFIHRRAWRAIRTSRRPATFGRWNTRPKERSGCSTCRPRGASPSPRSNVWRRNSASTPSRSCASAVARTQRSRRHVRTE